MVNAMVKDMLSEVELQEVNKEKEAGKKQPKDSKKGKEPVKSKEPTPAKGRESMAASSSTATGVISKTTSNPKSQQSMSSAVFNAEVAGILKELHENQNKMSDRLEKLSSRVDTIYNYPNEEYQYEGSYDYETEQYEDIDLENIDPSGNESFEGASEVSEPPRRCRN